jgi:hypothetical protein
MSLSKARWSGGPFGLAGVLSFAAFLLIPSSGIQAAEDGRVLPQGRFRLSYSYARSGDISSKYNSSGSVESLLAPYQLQLDSTNLRTFDSNLSTLIDLLNATGLRFDETKKNEFTRGLTIDPSKPLIGDALERGSLSIDGEGIRTQQMLSLQYGLTDRIAVGLLVPVVRTQVSIRAGLSGNNTAKDIYQSFIASDPNLLGSFNEVPLALSLIGDSDTDTLQDLLAARGYERVENTDETGIGDVGVGGRWNWWNETGTRTGDWIGSLQLSTTAPTGRLSQPSEITRFDIGQGTWELQAAQVFNYTPWRLLTLTASAHYSYRLPAERIKRVRNTPDDLIPDASTEELVEMRLGEKFWGILGARLQFTQAFSVDCGIEAYWRGQDRYQGNRAKDYTYLSNDTESYTETLQVGASLSTIPAFLSSSFPIPLDASLNYYWVPRGTNTLQTDFATAEVAMYF